MAIAALAWLIGSVSGAWPTLRSFEAIRAGETCLQKMQGVQHEAQELDRILTGIREGG